MGRYKSGGIGDRDRYGSDRSSSRSMSPRRRRRGPSKFSDGPPANDYGVSGIGDGKVRKTGFSDSPSVASDRQRGFGRGRGGRGRGGGRGDQEAQRPFRDFNGGGWNGGNFETQMGMYGGGERGQFGNSRWGHGVDEMRGNYEIPVTGNGERSHIGGFGMNDRFGGDSLGGREMVEDVRVAVLKFLCQVETMADHCMEAFSQKRMVGDSLRIPFHLMVVVNKCMSLGTQIPVITFLMVLGGFSLI